MPEQSRRRQDSRRDTTRAALVEAAESLFAQHGVDGVSTRQIGAAIGSLNTNVVAYHFGSKEALVEAVYRHRLPEIDRRRGELLNEARSAGKAGDLTTLMRVFALPLFEQTDTAGRHSYARFLSGVERSGLTPLRGLIFADFPDTARVIDEMARLLPENAAAEVHLRLRLAMSLLIAALQIADADASASREDAERLFETAIAMATASLRAPEASQPVASTT